MGDISAIKPVERQIEIVDPVNKLPIGLRIGMVSLNDPIMTKIKRSIMDERLRNESKGKSWKADDIETNKNRLTFAATTGWEWYDPKPSDERGNDYQEDPATFHGEQPNHNFKNYVEVVTELSWVRDQIDEELGDTEAFFAHSKPI